MEWIALAVWHRIREVRDDVDRRQKGRADAHAGGVPSVWEACGRYLVRMKEVADRRIAGDRPCRPSAHSENCPIPHIFSRRFNEL